MNPTIDIKDLNSMNNWNSFLTCSQFVFFQVAVVRRKLKGS